MEKEGRGRGRGGDSREGANEGGRLFYSLAI